MYICDGTRVSSYNIAAVTVNLIREVLAYEIRLRAKSAEKDPICRL